MNASNITYRIVALTMAFLMFFTSVGFTVDMHYCRGEFKTFSLFGQAKSCHDIGEGMKNCPHHKKMMEAKKTAGSTLNKKDCCSNKIVYVQSDQDQQHQIEDAIAISPQLQYFAKAFIVTFLNSFVVTTENPSYAHYEAPLISRENYVLFESFLL